MRELIAAEGDDLVRARAFSRPQLHEGAGRFAPFFIRPRHHGGKLDGRVLVERDLYLDARNILSAGDDDVLGAILDLDIAVGMLHGEVAGVQPAAAEASSAVAFGSLR